eukprot:scaffold3601_cov215-Prasinococcus_capsulatus_cf.AAC.1
MSRLIGTTPTRMAGSPSIVTEPPKKHDTLSSPCGHRLRSGDSAMSSAIVWLPSMTATADSHCRHTMHVKLSHVGDLCQDASDADDTFRGYSTYCSLLAHGGRHQRLWIDSKPGGISRCKPCVDGEALVRDQGVIRVRLTSEIEAAGARELIRAYSRKNDEHSYLCFCRPLT